MINAVPATCAITEEFWRCHRGGGGGAQGSGRNRLFRNRGFAAVSTARADEFSPSCPASIGSLADARTAHARIPRHHRCGPGRPPACTVHRPNARLQIGYPCKSGVRDMAIGLASIWFLRSGAECARLSGALDALPIQRHTERIFLC